MDTQQLNRCLATDPYVNRDDKYAGVFAIDTLPKKRSSSKVYVVNTSPSYIPVGHWVVLAKDKFFCSYGRSAGFYGIHGNYECNKQQLQSTYTSVCGLYVIAFTKAICRGYDVQEFLNCFTDSPKLNDRIISKSLPLFECITGQFPLEDEVSKESF
ncbi:MAG: hypothetical protein ACR2M9_01020 [Cyanophyceae cyanobacterium]